MRQAYMSQSYREPHRFYKVPGSGKIFDAARAPASAITLLFKGIVSRDGVSTEAFGV
jgi:hypothetical protein